MSASPLFRVRAVLFDCDGVLVDSEPITNGVLRDMLAERGWAMSADECLRRFVGKTVRSQAALIEAHTGQPFTEDWLQAFYVRRNARLAAELQPIDGAVATVQAVHARVGGRIACASGADLAKVQMQLAQVGLAALFGAHVFSGHDLPRSKPFPDVYLKAADALATPPADCLVVEDTVTGVQAGVAAGATVVGFAPAGQAAVHTEVQALREAGAAHIITHMRELPGLIRV
ncbi:HAD family hydrolase [Comamonas serinivorans]|uniref:HAD family hydrolase n=1 Tax=Comamonas serinivorans TaxID=1082851 RepID=A0A1Y0ERB2_9BURK|nr:HAD family phosphatase [Comamonas serinivorans]ARU05960.1 HAD family hydrolase [Comamonas serinivorans]